MSLVGSQKDVVDRLNLVRLRSVAVDQGGEGAAACSAVKATRFARDGLRALPLLAAMIDGPLCGSTRPVRLEAGQAAHGAFMVSPVS